VRARTRVPHARATHAHVFAGGISERARGRGLDLARDLKLLRHNTCHPPKAKKLSL